MYIPPNRWLPLNGPFQITTDYRYVIDSDRFWRKEYHPRFADIITSDEINAIFTSVNTDLSFPLTTGEVSRISTQLMNWLSGFRFVDIPAKNPYCVQQFEGDLYFSLRDVLSQVSFSEYKLDPDDFNVVNNTVDSGKNDRTKLGVGENNKQGSTRNTANDYTSRDTNSVQNTANVESVDENNNTNTTDVSDVFLSPQNQGVSPTNANRKGEGVSGITLNNTDTFTTNTSTALEGSTDVNHRGRIDAGNTDTHTVEETDDTHINSGTSTELATDQDIELENTKTANLHESLDFDRAKKLQEFFDLNSGRLWLELQNRLGRWILQMDIAQTDNIYLGLPKYD